MKILSLLGLLVVSQSSIAKGLDQTQQQFYSKIAKHCGLAFEGKVVEDNQPSASFTDKKMVMHVRECDESVLRIPFHVGNDSSRTWVLSKTQNGLSLEHDHRHKDGTSSELTMYGGDTSESGSMTTQSFPADEYSRTLFVQHDIPQSVDNTWQLVIDGERFSYRLIRPGRRFQVDFDLTQPIEAPHPPWGAK